MNDEIRKVLTEVITPELATEGLNKVAEPLGAMTSGLGYGQAPTVTIDFAEWLFDRLEQQGYSVHIARA